MRSLHTLHRGHWDIRLRRKNNYIMMGRCAEVLSGGQATRAGKALITCDSTSQEYADAIRTVNEWRSAHLQALSETFSQVIGVSESYHEALAVQRLKRLSSIKAKLIRRETQKLASLDDVGGCRIILPDLSSTYDAVRRFRSNQEIILKPEGDHDYINEPKALGYRSHHLICICDDPLPQVKHKYRIEIQFRSHLQHLWTTAVETMGFITGDQLKAGEGDEEMLEFFKLVSSLFAHDEGTPLVPGVTQNLREIVSRVTILDRKLKVCERLRKDSQSIYEIYNFDDNGQYEPSYYLLRFRIGEQLLECDRFDQDDSQKALEEYFAAENDEAMRDDPSDIVLVFAESLSAVKQAYPNYYVNLAEFSDKVESLY